MANPRVKNGYLPIANELAEQFARVNITGQEWRIIWVLLRQTWGWENGDRRKDWDWISITQFEKKTGMKRANVHKSITSLLAKRLIVKEKNGLKFNQNYNEWVLAKRLIVLAKSITPVSQKTNEGVSQLATHKRNVKETNTKESYITSATADGTTVGISTHRKSVTFPQEWYRSVLQEYQRLKGIALQGPEFSPVQQTVKTIFMAGRSVDQVVGCMQYFHECAANGSQIWQSWTITTVRKNIALYLAGKLTA